ncbi:hypothetical protein [Hafnia psychrotolerans]|uniref:Uncharacterized protein n=1 Tax=Hafnia psychrotolerans TaxID=1477018 RepID=A0ABQ1GTI3_9GAMM|nr:hypothetical protein [Hafnia psychrotolerans]GGA49545.1 hypothetical protein GCM10011328_26080 [Hafnia psychrotolerans]
MANWGALFTDQYGNPWTTPDTTPMSLVQKIALTPSTGGEYTLPVNASSPYIIACHATVNNVIFWLRKVDSTYTLSYAVSGVGGNPGTVTIYIFGYVIPQPLPKWGVAIWNAAGQCILTNETKVMNPPTGYGTIGSTTDIGYLVDKTVTGKWAVMPRVMGVVTGVFQGTQPRPYSSPIDTIAYYNGSTTRITAGTRVAPGDAIVNIGYANSRDQIFAIDVSRY